MATVMASGDVAHGQMTSGFKPWAWNTFKNASHDETDPKKKEMEIQRDEKSQIVEYEY